VNSAIYIIRKFICQAKDNIYISNYHMMINVRLIYY